MIERRLLGSTGLSVAKLALGGWMYGFRCDERESREIVDAAIDAGIDLIDTADSYSAGRSEEILGRALARDGKRNRVLLATKAGLPFSDGRPDLRGASRRHVIASCEQSLRRLRTDHIDLYQLHRRDPTVPIEETLDALEELVRAGKVRHVGTSSFPAWAVVEALWVAERRGLAPLATEQPPYNILDRRIERELLPACEAFGLAVLAWSPVGGGLLTGKYRRGEPLPRDSRLAHTPPAFARRLTERTYDVVEALGPIAAGVGLTIAQLALAWCLSRPGVTAAIVGPRTPGQLGEAIAAADAWLPDHVLAAIDELVPPGEWVSPFYEAGPEFAAGVR